MDRVFWCHNSWVKCHIQCILCHKYSRCHIINTKEWCQKVWLWCHVECVWCHMCAKWQNFQNCCDRSIQRVFQHRYSGCDAKYSGFDVRYSCIFMKAVALISYIFLRCHKYTVCGVIPTRCDVIKCSCDAMHTDCDLIHRVCVMAYRELGWYNWCTCLDDTDRMDVVSDIEGVMSRNNACDVIYNVVWSHKIWTWCLI